MPVEGADGPQDRSRGGVGEFGGHLLIGGEAPGQKAAGSSVLQVESGIQGEFALYPTLYLEDGASRRLLARGFAPYEQVAAKLADAASAPVLGPVCTLDGHCD